MAKRWKSPKIAEVAHLLKGSSANELAAAVRGSTGSGPHGDKRLRRTRTRNAQKIRTFEYERRAGSTAGNDNRRCPLLFTADSQPKLWNSIELNQEIKRAIRQLPPQSNFRRG